ncbi:MAG TPA: CGNR zinc finger domain-containing protein [Candidatus Eremiobacteraceae bacterium]|nr:CGNR zinc finger domain-containing protein [Candidatus Eremiobacteraceae bacterium]
MKYRDRDDGVTRLPILVDSFPYDMRDGRIIRFDGEDMPVRIVPRDAVKGLFDRKIWERVNSEFNQAFNAISKDALTELKALVLLFQAIGNKSHDDLKSYIKRKAPIEAARNEQLIAGLLAKLGEKKPSTDSAAKENYLANAVRSLWRRTRHPLSELGRQLNAHARLARFVIWWDESAKKFSPGLYCTDFVTALAIALFFRDAAICERCGTWFIPTSKKPQRFCSLRCGNADRKARQRERTAQSKQKRGKGDGTLQTR